MLRRAVALTLLMAALLYVVAWQVTRTGLDHQARVQASMYAQGTTPWDWLPRTASDLIAGRVFGPASVLDDGKGLVVRSADGETYELGLPLPRAVDLMHFSRLRLDLDAERPTRLRWLLRENLDSQMLHSTALSIAPGSHSLTVNLAKLRWSDTTRQHARKLPPHAAMLRLMLRHGKNSIVRIRQLHWLPALGQTLPLAAQPWPTLARALPSVFANTGDQLPVWRLPLLIPVETMLNRRDRLQQAIPAAIVVTSGKALERAPSPAARTCSGWLYAGLYILCVLALLYWRRRRPDAVARHIAGLFEIIICLGPSLLWAVGLQGAPDLTPAWLVVMIASFALALWLAWRSHGSDWQWLTWQGQIDWRDWMAPAVTVTAALLLCWSAKPLWVWPGPGHVLAYLGWAGLQQILILAVIMPRLQPLLRPAWLASLGCAVLFALTHAPNALLMQLCLFAELSWAWRFVRRPVLLPVLLAHAAAALLLQAGVNGLPLRSLEIGSRFLR